MGEMTQCECCGETKSADQYAHKRSTYVVGMDSGNVSAGLAPRLFNVETYKFNICRTCASRLEVTRLLGVVLFAVGMLVAVLLMGDLDENTTPEWVYPFLLFIPILLASIFIFTQRRFVFLPTRLHNEVLRRYKDTFIGASNVKVFTQQSYDTLTKFARPVASVSRDAMAPRAMGIMAPPGKSKKVVCATCEKRQRFSPAPGPGVAVIGIRYAWECPDCGAAVCSACSMERFGSSKPDRATCPSCHKTVKPVPFLAKELPGEDIEQALNPYIDQLESVYRQHETFLLEGQEAARAIGTEINERYEMEGMDYACDEVRSRLGRRAARSLEMSWHGIGSWWG